MQLQMDGTQVECGAMVHNIRRVDADTDVCVVPVFSGPDVTVEPDEWMVVATVDPELGMRCMKWATKKGCVCRLRNWPIEIGGVHESS